jgi:hypothetical protein
MVTATPKIQSLSDSKSRLGSFIRFKNLYLLLEQKLLSQAKTIATLITYPLIRTKMIIQTGGAPEGMNIPRVLMWIVKNEGFVGLYKGVWILSYKTVLFNALMMTVRKWL